MEYADTHAAEFRADGFRASSGGQLQDRLKVYFSDAHVDTPMDMFWQEARQNMDVSEELSDRFNALNIPPDIIFCVGGRYFRHWSDHWQNKYWVGFTIVDPPYQRDDGTTWANVLLDKIPDGETFITNPREIELNQVKYAFRVD